MTGFCVCVKTLSCLAYLPAEQFYFIMKTNSVYDVVFTALGTGAWVLAEGGIGSGVLAEGGSVE